MSLGGGQASSAMLIAICDKLTVTRDGGVAYDFGAIKLDLVQFADTGHELRATYRNIEFLADYAKNRGVRVDVVRRKGRTLGQWVTDRVAGKTKSAPAIPFHLSPKGRAKQHCTRDFKGRPLDSAAKKAAKKVGLANDVTVLVGFTID